MVQEANRPKAGDHQNPSSRVVTTLEEKSRATRSRAGLSSEKKLRTSTLMTYCSRKRYWSF
jgi:hypothetical protein